MFRIGILLGVLFLVVFERGMKWEGVFFIGMSDELKGLEGRC